MVKCIKLNLNRKFYENYKIKEITMHKVNIVIDSTVYLPEEIIKKEQLKVVSLNVLEGDQSYKELEINNEFVFSTLNSGKSLSTSQPSPNEFLEVYEKLVKEGSEFIFVIGLSKGVSGTYQSAILAQKMFDKPEIVYVFDTNNAAFGTELLTLELIKLRNKGLAKDDIINKMNDIISKTSLYFTVENLHSLQKGGRLSKTQAFIGTLLKVKPVIKMIDGKLKLVHKERTFGKLYDYLMNEIANDAKENQKLHIRLLHINSVDANTIMKEKIKTAYPNAVITESNYIGPVFSIHIGDKGFGVTWFFN
jgi:DegV family protein with EDD domain